MQRQFSDLIRCAPRTAETERADWQGETQAAKLQGMRAAKGGSMQSVARASFGRKVAR